MPGVFSSEPGAALILLCSVLPVCLPARTKQAAGITQIKKAQPPSHRLCFPGPGWPLSGTLPERAAGRGNGLEHCHSQHFGQGFLAPLVQDSISLFVTGISRF